MGGPGGDSSAQRVEARAGSRADHWAIPGALDGNPVSMLLQGYSHGGQARVQLSLFTSPGRVKAHLRNSSMIVNLVAVPHSPAAGPRGVIRAFRNGAESGVANRRPKLVAQPIN
jgi:hypothetical protein